jgi:hypothetical protein
MEFDFGAAEGEMEEGGFGHAVGLRLTEATSRKN